MTVAHVPQDLAALALRPPSTVMRLERMGSFFPSRLSFMRILLRRVARENWQFRQAELELDKAGFGHGVWRIETPHGVLSFVAFSTELADEDRTDRVIAERWDASFALLEGEASAEDVARLRENVPRQEAGRVSSKELVLSRANKSVRLFEYVADSLSRGEQPKISELAKVGYLMRTTAVYGNGKFGLGDYPKVAANPSFNGPFLAELLTVFLIRRFQIILVEHVARMRGGGRAAKLAPELARNLGIGNATGLGMAPFLVRHPVLLHHWIMAREVALARVRAHLSATPKARGHYKCLLERATAHVAQWNVEDERQQSRIVNLRTELKGLADYSLEEHSPWDALYLHAQSRLGLEAQELIVSMLIELHPECCSDLEIFLGQSPPETIDGRMSLGQLKALIEQHYDWALAIDFDRPEARKFFWYYSEGKDEPRLGNRFEDAGAELEMKIPMAWYVSQLYGALSGRDEADLRETVAAFLLREPQWRLATRRAMTTARFPFSEIHDNTIGEHLLPIDMLRCKLSYFGATKFDPKSDLWTRINMYQGAPLLDEVSDENADDWWLPVIPGL